MLSKKMCKKIICRKCRKYTWTGCGKHIKQALKGVPVNQICKCKYPQKNSTKM